MATTEQINALTALYVGYFNRAPDPAGLEFWIDQLDNGREYNTIAADFAASPEAIAIYPYLSTPDVSSSSAFLTAIYQNLFNRAPDTDGLEFWTGVLDSGAVSVADMIEAIINGAEDGSQDKAIMDNKTDVGLDFAVSAADTSGFTYDDDAAAAASAVLDGVVDTAESVTEAKAETAEFIENGSAVIGETFTLTTGVDTVTGTADNDTFDGSYKVLDNADDVATLGGLDSIDGGAGTDTLIVNNQEGDTTTGVDEEETTTAAVTIGAGTEISNVEKIEIRSGGSVDADLSGATGVESIDVEAAEDIILTANADSITVNAGNDVELTATGENITVNAEDDVYLTADADSIIVNAGDNVELTADGDAVTNIDVTAGGNVDIDAAGANLENVSVVASTDYDVDINTDGNASSVSVEGGHAVTISDDAEAADEKLTSVTLNGGDDGATINANITELSISNLESWSAVDVFADAGERDLALTVDNFSGEVVDDQATSVSVTSAGTESNFTFSANSATSVTLNADVDMTLSGSADVLTAVDINGDGAVTATLTTSVLLGSIDASDNTGGVEIVGAIQENTSFTGGTGDDTIKLKAGNTQAIAMGEGDDTVTLKGALGEGGTLDGGDGNDTLVMSASLAEELSANGDFTAAVAGFENVVINQTSADTVIDLANLAGISNVSSAGTAYTPAVLAVGEQQELDFEFTSGTAAGGNITVGGITVAIDAFATMGVISDAIAAALNGQTLTSPASGGPVTAISDSAGHVTVTFPDTAGDVADIEITDAAAALVNVGYVTPEVPGVLAEDAIESTLTLDNMASGGTFELTGDAGSAVTVNVTDAETGEADELNVVLTSDVNLAGGTLNVANVETINIDSDDADDEDETAVAHTLALAAAAATSVVVSGDAGLALDLTGSVAVSSIDTSANSGAVNVTTGADLSTTFVGGDGNTVVDMSSITTDTNTATITTGAGNDTITGGAGDNTIDAGAGFATVMTYGGDDSITVGDEGSMIDAGEGDNSITSGADVDLIIAGDGDNTINSGAGADVIIVGSGNNTIDAGADYANITATGGDNDITVGDAGSLIDLGAGNNTITAGAGADDITTTDGDNTINAGDGANDITTGAGVDSITTGADDDTIIAGAGDNTINAGDGTNSVTTLEGNDDITTGAGVDTIGAGAGDDAITAGAGDDAITGGAGADTMTGGEGADTFIYNDVADSQGETVDTIIDFVSGSDTIDLTAVAGIGGIDENTYLGESNTYLDAMSALSVFSDGSSAAAVLDIESSTLYIDVDGDGGVDMQINLTGVTDLSASDFVTGGGLAEV
ncbi:DUF4214 domain-containing protein [Candidatus Halocynthiibacter alkanivorans]|uniref:DUF4214 domain-containing protein n=1 Tax=Candidatus Halocynthiibacter alkanivorans TaxID=2267619 RepID=UPI000DF2F2AE|nr:DUF4214 domain-containing protein [Candidatus Halocynthiibacter alkanivorans]